MVASSPYLNRPTRTLEQAMKDREANVRFYCNAAAMRVLDVMDASQTLRSEMRHAIMNAEVPA